MFLLRKRMLRFAHLWYDDPVPSRDVDVIVHRQAPIARPGVPWVQRTTLALDLTKTEETLIAEMKKDCRRQIRVAHEKDKIVCTITDSPDPLLRAEFYDFYDRFALTKGLSPLDRDQHEEMARQGQLAIAMAREVADGTGSPMPLVYNSFLLYRSRTRGLYGATQRLWEQDPERRNLIGRANRLLEWECIRWAHRKGFRTYDMGGWYSGTENTQLLSINRFKEGFGGHRITEFDAIQGVTLRGRLAVGLWKLLKGH